MDKNILKNIAKDWCKSIIYANDLDSFTELDIELDYSEEQYILSECRKIADKITDAPVCNDLNNIIKRYYTIEK